MWLVVSTTNNDPLLVGNLYLKLIKQYKIVTNLLKIDAGTENIHCQDLQAYCNGWVKKKLSYMLHQQEIRG